SGLSRDVIVKRRAEVSDHALAYVAHEIRREIFGHALRHRQTDQQSRDHPKIDGARLREILSEREAVENPASALIARYRVEDRLQQQDRPPLKQSSRDHQNN